MAQASITPLDPDTTSGTDLAGVLVDAEEAALTLHSGTSRPSYAQPGTLWIDTTTNPVALKGYDGTSDIIIARLDTSLHKLVGPASVVSVASAATTDVLGAASEFINVTGSATITSFGSTPLQVKYARFDAGATLVEGATIELPYDGGNIVTESDDNAVIVSDESGNAVVVSYQRRSGEPLVAPAVAAAFPAGTIMLFRQGSAPTGWTKDTTNFDDHAIRVTTGSITSGGSYNFSTIFSNTTTASHTLTNAEIPVHSHSPGSMTASVGTQINHSGAGGSATSVVRNLSNSDFQTFSADAGGHNVFDGISLSGDSSGTLTLASGTVTFGGGGTANVGGDGSHTHGTDLRLRYIDCIFATKT